MNQHSAMRNSYFDTQTLKFTQEHTYSALKAFSQINHAIEAIMSSHYSLTKAYHIGYIYTRLYLVHQFYTFY